MPQITQPEGTKGASKADDTNASRASSRMTDVERLILDTARTVFEAYGVRRANIEDVAARAGVSRSTIYRRFPTKDDLFETVVRREAELFFSTLDKATTGRTPQEAVIEAFPLGARLVQDSPCIPGSSKANRAIRDVLAYARLSDRPIRRGDRTHTAAVRRRHPRARPGQRRRHPAARRPRRHRVSHRPPRHFGPLQT